MVNKLGGSVNLFLLCIMRIATSSRRAHHVIAVMLAQLRHGLCQMLYLRLLIAFLADAGQTGFGRRGLDNRLAQLCPYHAIFLVRSRRPHYNLKTTAGSSPT